MKYYYLMYKPNLKPKTKAELQEQIYYEMSKHGNNCNLNHIDVSNVNNMSSLLEKQVNEYNAKGTSYERSSKKLIKELDNLILYYSNVNYR